MNNKQAKAIRRKAKQQTNEIFMQGVRELMGMKFLQRLQFCFIIMKGQKKAKK